jgi:eukaryotic-like serine/threonine-protein kinase
VQLEQSPFLNVLSDDNVGEQLKLMGRQRDERLTQDLAREVCQRERSKAILVGSIARLGIRYVIGLNALNCNTRAGLASEQVEADSRERVLKALGSQPPGCAKSWENHWSRFKNTMWNWSRRPRHRLRP